MGGATAGPFAEAARRCNFFFLHPSHSPPVCALPLQAQARCNMPAGAVEVRRLAFEAEMCATVFIFSARVPYSLCFTLLSRTFGCRRRILRSPSPVVHDPVEFRLVVLAAAGWRGAFIQACLICTLLAVLASGREPCLVCGNRSF